MSRQTQSLLVVILIVVALAIYVVVPNSPGIHIGGINKDFQTVLGLDLIGGVQALLEADLPETAAVTSEQMDNAVSIVENRVNGLGLSDAVVQKAGDRRIVVELPGVKDPEEALATLRQTGLLELVDFSNIPAEYVNAMVGSTINTIMPGQSAVDSTMSLTVTAPITTPLPTVITGADLEAVNVTNNPQSGEYEVAFTLSSKGAKVFSDFTGSHIGKPLAIVVDKMVISVPTINQQIPNGQGVITGGYTAEQANNMAVQLRYGSLPVPLKVIEVRTVGPTLGEQSLRQSLIAGLIGFVIVILFMLLYYRLLGGVATIGILIYALITFAIFRYLPVTLTLAGVAGFMLSTGSALDANILIFERLKEELRSGKNLRQSSGLAWTRAWPSIRDSNIATLITSGILFWFGSTFGATIVKGFSITLFLGVIVSLFTSLVATRVLLEVVLKYFTSKDYEKWIGI